MCNRNLGSEDYIKIAETCEFIFIKNLPDFNDNNSNQQQRFITLIDIIYDKGVLIAVTANQKLDEFTSQNELITVP